MGKIDLVIRLASLGISAASVYLVYSTNKERNQILAQCGASAVELEQLESTVTKVMKKEKNKKKFLWLKEPIKAQEQPVEVIEVKESN